MPIWFLLGIRKEKKMKKDIVSTRNKAEQLLKVLSQMGTFIPNEKTKHTNLLDATECVMIELLKDADAEFYVSGVLFDENGEIIEQALTFN